MELNNICHQENISTTKNQFLDNFIPSTTPLLNSEQKFLKSSRKKPIFQKNPDSYSDNEEDNNEASENLSSNKKRRIKLKTIKIKSKYSLKYCLDSPAPVAKKNEGN